MLDRVSHPLDVGRTPERCEREVRCWVGTLRRPSRPRVGVIAAAIAAAIAARVAIAAIAVIAAIAAIAAALAAAASKEGPERPGNLLGAADIP